MPAQETAPPEAATGALTQPPAGETAEIAGYPDLATTRRCSLLTEDGTRAELPGRPGARRDARRSRTWPRTRADGARLPRDLRVRGRPLLRSRRVRRSRRRFRTPAPAEASDGHADSGPDASALVASRRRAGHARAARRAVLALPAGRRGSEGAGRRLQVAEDRRHARRRRAAAARAAAVPAGGRQGGDRVHDPRAGQEELRRRASALAFVDRPADADLLPRGGRASASPSTRPTRRRTRAGGRVREPRLHALRARRPGPRGDADPGVGVLLGRRRRARRVVRRARARLVEGQADRHELAAGAGRG